MKRKIILLIIVLLLLNENIYPKNDQNQQIIDVWNFPLDTISDSSTYYRYSVATHDSIFAILWKKRSGGTDSFYLKRITNNYADIDIYPKSFHANISDIYAPVMCLNEDSIFIVYGSGKSQGGGYTEDVILRKISRGDLGDTVSKIFTGNFMWVSDFEYSRLAYSEPSVSYRNGNMLITAKEYTDWYYNYSGFGHYGPYIIYNIYNLSRGLRNRGYLTDSVGFNTPTDIAPGDSSFGITWPYNNEVRFRAIKVYSNDSSSTSDERVLFYSNQNVEMGNNAIAYGNGNYVVVWYNYFNCSHSIMGAKINSNGEITDSAITVYANQNVKGYPSVSFNGEYFIVVWPEFISVPTENIIQNNERHVTGFYNIKGVMIDSSWDIVEQFNITNNTSNQTYPFIKTSDNNVSLIVYANYDSTETNSTLWGTMTNYYNGISKIKNKNIISPAVSPLYSQHNKRIILRYSLPSPYNIEINIYNIAGNKIKSYNFGRQYSGSYSLNLNLSNYSNGIYFYNFNYDNKAINGKLVILR